MSWRDVTNAVMKAYGNVLVDEPGHNAGGICQVKWHFGPDAPALDRLLPAFDLAVALWIEGRGICPLC